MYEYEPHQSHLRVATACPRVMVGSVEINKYEALGKYDYAEANDASLLVFPELSLTGYTIGDVVNQNKLLENAKNGLIELSEYTEHKNTAMIVGLPLQVQNNLYNCAAVLADGQIKGLVPKQNLPTYGEFYEDRWYQTWDQGNTEITIGDQKVPFGTDLLFEIGGIKTGVEICEDLWVSSPPSTRLAEHGALVIANPSASPEQIGKEDYRRQLIAQQSGRLISGYVYAGCHESESTMDVVMSGHQIVAENGTVLIEREPFDLYDVTFADIDIDRLQHDRRRQGFANKLGMLVIPTEVERAQTTLSRHIDKNPFLPEESPEKQNERLEKIFQIQAHGLAERMRSTGQEKLVLGLSGGLDSTLALFVAIEAARIQGKKPSDMIWTLTMPGPASSEETQDDAQILAGQLGIPNEVKPIKSLVIAELEVLGHDGKTQDITYENVQARARTSILFNYGNKEHCMVLGTGDLSEIAAGWCTYNADHMSHYNVNASVAKTVVKAEVEYLGTYKFSEVRDITDRICGRIVSPELVKEAEGKMQSTDEKIGPVELRDFFMGHHTRYGEEPAKLAYLAKKAFKDEYDRDEIEMWLTVYLDRFYQNQWKRSVMTDGPKVGSVAFSPRGDWRAPSDMPVAVL